MNILLLMMGGKGERFGADIPKQYIKIHGKPIFSYIISKYSDLSIIHQIILVSHKDWIDYVSEQLELLNIHIPWHITSGGENRSESVLHGLDTAKQIAAENDIVLIHDATHPYVDSENILKVIHAAQLYGGATLGGLEFDTMYQMDENDIIQKVIPRQSIVSGASPEAFRFNDIYKIYKKASPEKLKQMTSAGAIALDNQIPMKVIPTSYLNLKITHSDDMKLFLRLFQGYFF